MGVNIQSHKLFFLHLKKTIAMIMEQEIKQEKKYILLYYSRQYAVTTMSLTEFIIMNKNSSGARKSNIIF